MSFKERFIELLNNQLPGESAHIPLLPAGRKVSSEVREHAIKPMVSAVALHIRIEETNDISIIFIERAEYEGTHSGQIAFPGGKREANDIDILHTARRESEEELGIPITEGTMIGKLTPVYIPVSNYDVYPFVILHGTFPVLKPDLREVKSIIITSLLDFTKMNAIHYKKMAILKDKPLANVPGFYIEKKWLWGASALIVNELATIYRAAHERVL
jgi:8-oxo-dGTP pyrophosphatase MutT (NUDIX family)